MHGGIDRLELFLGVLLGIVYVAAPGPVNVETVRRGLAGGFRMALAVQLGALVGDLPYAGLVLAGIGATMTDTAAQTLVGMVGTGLLMVLGVVTLRQGWRAPHISDVGQVGQSAKRSFWVGSALAVANPSGVTFWLSIAGALLRNPHWNPGAFLGALVGGIALAAIVLALLVGWWCAIITPRLLRGVSCGCGIALICSSLFLAYSLF